MNKINVSGLSEGGRMINLTRDELYRFRDSCRRKNPVKIHYAIGWTKRNNKTVLRLLK